MHGGDERGLGMPEAMVAVLLFSVTALASINYLHALKQAQDELVQRQLALAFAHQALELHRLDGRDLSWDLPQGWRIDRVAQPRGPACRRVTVEVRIPSGGSAALSEWFCRKDPGDAPP